MITPILQATFSALHNKTTNESVYETAFMEAWKKATPPDIGSIWLEQGDLQEYQVVGFAVENDVERPTRDTVGDWSGISLLPVPVEKRSPRVCVLLKNLKGTQRLVSASAFLARGSAQTSDGKESQYDIWVSCPKPSFRWSLWYKRFRPLIDWWTARQNPVLKYWLIDDLDPQLADGVTGPLWAVNTVNTRQGYAQLLIDVMGDDHRPLCLKVHPSWLPINLIAQAPRANLRRTQGFLNLVRNKQLLIIDPVQAANILASPEGQEEAKRLQERDRFVNYGPR